MAREIVAIKERGFSTSEYEDVTANTILELDSALIAAGAREAVLREALKAIATLRLNSRARGTEAAAHEHRREVHRIARAALADPKVEA
jgi:hypothetical protein